MYDNFCYNYIEFFLTGLNISVLRGLIIKMKSININVEILLKLLVDKLTYIIGDIRMIIVIKEIAKYNYIINKSYRDIVSLEALFVRLYKTINYEELL